MSATIKFAWDLWRKHMLPPELPPEVLFACEVSFYGGFGAMLDGLGRPDLHSALRVEYELFRATYEQRRPPQSN